MKRGPAILLLGVIIGATLSSIAAGNTLEKLYQEKETLKVRLFETTDRLGQLERQLHTREAGQVRVINIELDSSSEIPEELALRQALSEITSELIGEKIDQLKPSLLVKLLHQRLLTVEGGQYEILVRWVVIGEEVTFNLTASPVNQTRKPVDPL